MENDEYVKLYFSHNAFEDESYESAWALKKGDYYQLDNVLFYAKEYSCGDILKAEERDGLLYAKEIVAESGNSTIRILISDSACVEQVRADLLALGCSSELSNIGNLISVDIPDGISYAKVKKFLDAGEINRLWEYEEACIAKRHHEEMDGG